jgi:hypothetical protein
MNQSPPKKDAHRGSGVVDIYEPAIDSAIVTKAPKKKVDRIGSASFKEPRLAPRELTKSTRHLPRARPGGGCQHKGLVLRGILGVEGLERPTLRFPGIAQKGWVRVNMPWEITIGQSPIG